MAIGDFLARFGGGSEPAKSIENAEPEPTAAAPTRDDLGAALDRVEAMVTDGAVPSCVTARVERITHVVRDTVPRLDAIRGSASAYSVMATATDYLPEAVGGYLRLPRRFADSRPVDGGKTSLMVLVDQLDLLGSTMDKVFDAVCRDDATALVAHGRFLTEKFGHASSGGSLDTRGALPVPPVPGLDSHLSGPATSGSPDPSGPSGTAGTAEAASPASGEDAGEEASSPESAAAKAPDADQAGSAGSAESPGPVAEPPAADPPPVKSSLDLPEPGPASNAGSGSLLDLDTPLPAPAKPAGTPTPGPGAEPRLAPPSWT